MKELKLRFYPIIMHLLKDKNFKEPDFLLKELKFYYDGYLQSIDIETALYCPAAVQKYFSERGNLDNCWIEREENEILFKVLKRQNLFQLLNFLKLIIDDSYRLLVNKHEIMNPKTWQGLITNFNQFFYDYGYFTLKIIDGEYFLKITCREIRSNFSKIIKTFMFNEIDYELLKGHLLNADFKIFFAYVEDMIFQNNSILNLFERQEACNDQPNYEIFLKQTFLMVLKEMLIHVKKENKIRLFDFFNKDAQGKIII